MRYLDAEKFAVYGHFWNFFLRFFPSAKTTIYRTKRLTCKNHHTKGIRKNLRQTFYAVYGSFPIVLLWFFFETRMTFFASFFKAYTAKKFDA